MNVLDQPEWYRILDEFESVDNDYLSDQYDSFWEDKDKDKIDELREKYGNRYDERRSRSQYKKKALTTVMGAFLGRRNSSGQLHDQTGWEFWELKPFEKKDGVTGDILLAKPDEGKTIMVLLLPERETPNSVVEKSKKGIEVVKNNLGSFDFRASPDQVHSAIVVNPPRDDATKNAIESAGGDMASDIFVWRVYDVEESEESDKQKKILDHFADLDDDLNPSGLKMELLEVMESSVEIQNGREILPDFFISSHHSVFLDHVIGYVVQTREEKDDGPLTHFAQAELKDYISDTLFGTNMSEEASDRVELLLSRWNRMGIIRSVGDSRNEIDGDDFYRFTVSGRWNQDSIIENITGEYKSNTVDFEIEIDAMEQALEAYRDEYGEQATLESSY